jgi:hypothetical protein
MTKLYTSFLILIFGAGCVSKQKYLTKDEYVNLKDSRSSVHFSYDVYLLDSEKNKQYYFKNVKVQKDYNFAKLTDIIYPSKHELPEIDLETKMLLPATPLEFDSIKIGEKIEFKTKLVGNFIEITGRFERKSGTLTRINSPGSVYNVILDNNNKIIVQNNLELPKILTEENYFAFCGKTNESFMHKLENGDVIVFEAKNCRGYL